MKAKILSVVILSSVLASQAFAAADGTVTFKGIVADSPCDVNAANLNQTVDFGVIGVESLKSNNPSSEVPFEIKLENCKFENTAGAKGNITFNYTETSANSNLVKLEGAYNTSSLGIKILDAARNAVKTNTDNLLASKTNSYAIKYTAQVVPIDAATVTAGNITSVANWTLAYK